MDDVGRVHEAYSAEQVVHDVLGVSLLEFNFLTTPEERLDISPLQLH